MILFEYPFNERIRTYLRMERLLDRFNELAARTTAIDHHFALITLFELLEVSSRSDLKGEIMRDLDRQKQHLAGYRGNPAVEESMLNQMIRTAEDCFQRLEQMTGKIGQPLTDNDWLMTIRSRAAIPGGTCEFDLPAYHAWQQLPESQRQYALKGWAAAFKPVEDSVRMLLSLLRNSGHTQKVSASNGQFQQNLPQNRNFQLLRLSIDPNRRVVPEISANHLMVAVRMMREDAEGHLALHPADIDFQLTLCA